MSVIETVSADTLLGGRAVFARAPRSGLEWVDVVRHGISSRALDSMLKSIGLSQAELAQALDIPERTLARRKREGVLSREESAKLLRLARTVARAAEVFEGLDAALNWLKTPIEALEGATPLSLIDTDIGADSVMDTLGRIEHGVFA
ncbi:putative toxin-antitoxin system antitoxin component (TIGR02293 family) [Caballeronia udeis]|uniref:Toxin-antitoxin system antitoxin component (TIGR02293 family) n=1 Tax=Caballeronia udeis TaxID=1232866 RepID=A0ABW8N0H9_9BURK